MDLQSLSERLWVVRKSLQHLDAQLLRRPCRRHGSPLIAVGSNCRRKAYQEKAGGQRSNQESVHETKVPSTRRHPWKHGQLSEVHFGAEGTASLFRATCRRFTFTLSGAP